MLTLNTKHSIFDVGAVLDASPIFLLRDKSIDITIASMKISLNIQINRKSRKLVDWLPNKTTLKRLYLILIF